MVQRCGPSLMIDHCQISYLLVPNCLMHIYFMVEIEVEIDT